MQTQHPHCLIPRCRVQRGIRSDRSPHRPCLVTQASRAFRREVNASARHSVQYRNWSSVVIGKFLPFRIACADLWAGSVAQAMRGTSSSGADARERPAQATRRAAMQAPRSSSRDPCDAPASRRIALLAEKPAWPS
jgi:hypothetical protein